MRHGTSPRILRGENNTGEGHRVAYVAIKINAKFDAVQAEAEVLMARFRCNRYTFEGGTAAEKNALWWNLARTRPTKFGIFEYLQAAQDIAKLQEDVLKDLRSSWQGAWLQQQQSRQDHSGTHRNQFQISQDDWNKTENLLATFLYRSPILTLVVMPEQVLPDFYKKVIGRLKKLQLAHALRMVVCRHNQPVWMALRDLGVHEDFVPLRTKELTTAFRELGAAREENLDAQLKKKIKTTLGLCASIAKQVQSLKDNQSTDPPLWLEPLWQAVESAVNHRGQANPNLIKLGRFVTVAEIAQSVPQEFANLKRLADDLISLKNETLCHATTVWQKGDVFWREAETARSRCSEQVLTVLRSGVHRVYTGEMVRLLLNGIPRRGEQAAHQFGKLATYAHTLLEEVRVLPLEQKVPTFWDNLWMTFNSRVAVRGKARMDKEMAKLLSRVFNMAHNMPELTLDQIPGLLLEIALRMPDPLPSEEP